MKTNLINRNHIRGSALLITLVVVTVSAIVLGSYLLIVKSQTASVARSQAWNSIIPVTEAGLEEAMAMINKNTPIVAQTYIYTAAEAWAWTNTVANEYWSAFNNGVTSVTRTNIGGPGN